MENRALENYLYRHFEDDNAWLVYADWLLTYGDKRGELIQLYQMTNHSSPKTQTIFLGKLYQFYFDHYSEWLSQTIHYFARHNLLRTDTYIYWYYGFITEIFIKRGNYNTFSYFNLLLQEESCKFLRTLELRSDMDLTKFIGLISHYNLRLDTLIIRMSGKVEDISEKLLKSIEKLKLTRLYFVHPVLDIEEDLDLDQSDVDAYQQAYLQEIILNVQYLYHNYETFIAFGSIGIYIPEKNMMEKELQQLCDSFRNKIENFSVISYIEDIYIDSFSVGYRDTIISQSFLLNNYITLPKRLSTINTLPVSRSRVFSKDMGCIEKLVNVLTNNTIKIHSGYAKYAIKKMQHAIRKTGDYKTSLLNTLELIFQYGDNQDHYKILISLPDSLDEDVVNLIIQYIFPKNASNTYALDTLMRLKVTYPRFIKSLRKAVLEVDKMNQQINFRKHAAKALGDLGRQDKKIIAALRVASHSDPNKYVRKEAKQSLLKLVGKS